MLLLLLLLLQLLLLLRWLEGSLLRVKDANLLLLLLLLWVEHLLHVHVGLLSHCELLLHEVQLHAPGLLQPL